MMIRGMLANYRYFKQYADSIKKFTQYSIGTEKTAPRFVLFGSADYNNLGDHAISYAMKCFVRERFPHVELLEFSEKEIRQNTKDILEQIMPSDIILLVGGGNLGDHYIDQRIIRNAAMKIFKENTIILFPQSIDYSHTLRGALVKRADHSIFDKHKNFYLFIREAASFAVCRRSFVDCACYMVPDIVLSLDQIIEYRGAGGGLLCIRSDKESALSEKDKQIIREKFGALESFDTCLDVDVPLEMRENALQRIWEKIADAEFVITDRLHAMLFCVLIGTPCVVLKNSNKKIESTYEIIKECNNVFLAENADQIIGGLKSVSPQVKPNFLERYEPLVRALEKGILKNGR